MTEAVLVQRARLLSDEMRSFFFFCPNLEEFNQELKKLKAGAGEENRQGGEQPARQKTSGKLHKRVHVCVKNGLTSTDK